MNREKRAKLKKRLIFINLCFFVLLGGLIGRVTQIQLVSGAEYQAAAARQQRITLEGVDRRGVIYDRNRNPLTGMVDSYLYLIEKDRVDEDAKVILRSIGARRLSTKNDSYNAYTSVVYDESKTEELRKKYGAFVMESERRYEEEQPAVHLIGYVSAADGKGACGIEKEYDSILGQKEEKLYATADASGTILPGLGVYGEESGGVSAAEKNVQSGVLTTLDIKIQREADRLMKEADISGAMVVLDVETGEVLASSSAPVYQPYNVKAYLTSEKQEFINKAEQGEYPPGSIFKIIVAAAGLESGKLTPDSVFLCKGYEEIFGVRIKCSSGGESGHGMISFQQAFAKSCNSTFIQAGQRVGAEDILYMADNFGIGQKMLNHFSEERIGHLPTLDEVQGAGIGNLSIGQGTLLITPLQAAHMTEIIASGGIDRRPALIRGIEQNGEEERFTEDPPGRILSADTARKLQSMMCDTVTYGSASNIGTASGISAAGKTGSAQAMKDGQEVVHGWFTGYTPADKPRYVITVFVENGRSGKTSAVPLFKSMAEFLKDYDVKTEGIS